MSQGLDRFFALRIALLAVISSNPAIAAASSPTSTIAHLPNVQINAAKVDASGNIYLAGRTTASAGSAAAYIAKLSPNGASLYAVTIGSASSTTSATALAVDSTGAVYVAGTTTASDFPVSTGAAQSAGATAFAAKLDQTGAILYSASIGGNASTQPNSIVVNSKKELVVSGQQTTGTPQAALTSLFLLKLSADGSHVVAAPQGIGGLLTADPQDNIYVAGVPPQEGPTEPPATPGAFQGMPGTFFCGCPLFNFTCGGDQFVASLTPDLSQVRFLTYVTAKFGAFPAYIAIDPQGDILIAGTTSAPGYPTTPDSFEPAYTAASKTLETCGPPIPMVVTSPSGYVTVVKADGSGLIFSTFLSGTSNDRISFAALTSRGIYLAGQAGSVDLPGFDGAVPSPCVPVGFVTRMTLDGSALSSTRTPPGTPLAYDATSDTLLLASGNDLLRFDPSQATPIACVLDSADLRPVTSIAPGELLSLFGRFLYFASDPFAAAPNPVRGSFPTAFQGLGVAAGQNPASLLYVSEPQINFQVPYEIAGSPQANLTVTYPDVNGNTGSDSRTLPVSASNPVAFLSQPSSFNQTFPLALNADGTVNSQSHPAAAGTIVSIFLQGLGLTSPTPVSGLVNASPSVVLSLPVTVTPCVSTTCYSAPTFVSAGSLVGSISGVTQVQLRAPANPNPPYPFQTMFSLSVGSIAVRDLNLSFWVE